MKLCYFFTVLIMFFITSVVFSEGEQPFYQDRPFVQDYAEKIALGPSLSDVELKACGSDRNGRIQVLSNKGLLQVYQGELVSDRMHRPLVDMNIMDLEVYRGQFVYLTDKAVLSNAWAAKFYVAHGMADAKLFTMGNDFDVFVVGEKEWAYFSDGRKVWQQKSGGKQVKQIVFDVKRNRYLILCAKQIYNFSVSEKKLDSVFEGAKLSCLEFINNNKELLVGTGQGYLRLDGDSYRALAVLESKLPWPDICCVRKMGEKTWFGSTRGVFAVRTDGGIDYYASKRWLPDDGVIDIVAGPGKSVLVLTKQGLSIIHFDRMTLEQKAEHFDRLTRLRHMRYGFSSAFVMQKPGDFSTGTLIDQDNDGTWTSMYLAGEVFRYAATKSDESLANCYEAFEALERLFTINPLEGFPSRAFERRGYKVSDPDRWVEVEGDLWDWKATTSSDEIVGHFFAYSNFIEIMPDKAWRDRAIALLDQTMNHIMRNDWYLIDYDGKPTQWGKWNKDYVNRLPRQVGDRKLNSTEVISFLQTAYHFTGKEIYKEKAYELMEKDGYLDNIMIPITEIGRVEGIDLSTEWNHSDDELAFLSYWNLYRYAFTDELREKYRRVIREHWEIERPEKNPLWSFIYAMTGAAAYDLDEAIWYLKEMPLDFVGWRVKNSHRKDLEFIKGNFRNQTTTKVLPPDERSISKYNGNAFRLDGGEGGLREFSGDIYLFPYWMGRYVGVIK
ncbi:MAG: hypothetical protein JXD22_03930 [Sedimentisphaerales bacterium]|nr:hypothetical protein [Sedimentisphaerales bacterium]